MFGPFLINEVLTYKYLGLELDYRLSLKSFRTRILAKARSNQGRIWHMGIRSGVLSVKAAVNLYQALVLSIAEFSSEVWGFEKWQEGEQLQLDMAKYILRCSSKTSLPAVIGELGLMSLYGRRNYKKLVYWMHIITLPESRLLKHVYLASKSQSGKKHNWYRRVGQIFTLYGLNDIWVDNQKVYNLDGKHNNDAQDMKHHQAFWKNYLRKTILNYEEKNWLAVINNGTEYPKLRTYCSFKTRLHIEAYLFSSNAYGRSIHTSLRSGTNKLAIETGRWKHLAVRDRLCMQCDRKVVETELHFVVECVKYKDYRCELFTKILDASNSKWSLTSRSSQDCFLLLMNGTQDQYQMKIFTLFHSYLVRCFKIRNAEEKLI
jgi:hypothetical protein